MTATTLARAAAAAAADARGAGRQLTLHPGDVVFAQRGERLQTLLGSCIAIVLTDPRRTVAAMCHVVNGLPPKDGRTASTAFGDSAMVRMQGVLRAHGIEPRLCQALVYGGGNKFPHLVGGDGHVGDSNAHWALQALGALGARVLHHDLGGTAYRKLAWTVGPGLPEVTAVPV
jgi:chemotaxis protein CheD